MTDLRLVQWTRYLGMIDPHETRTRYNSLCLTLPTRPDTDAEDDPLSVISAAAGEESPWGKYFKDMELCKVIQLDLDRTYPEIEFFADQQTKKKMLNILFIWAKKNSDIAYRQGLNELLSPIMLVVADGKKIKATEDDGLTDVEKAWLDPDFEEHDAYAIFELVMIRMKKFFSLKNDLKANSASKSLAAQDPLYKEEKINYVVARSDFIQRVLLKKIEPSLAFHLNKLGLEPQIYGLRWLRLLFSREFLLEDCLRIWDVIFQRATPTDFPFAEYFAVAMLMGVKSILMQSDFSMCMAKLLNYPEPDSIKGLIENAIAIEKRIVNEGTESTSDSRESSPTKVDSPEKPPQLSSREKEASPTRIQDRPVGNASSAPKFFSSVNNMVESLTKLNPFGSLLNDSPSKEQDTYVQAPSPPKARNTRFEEISVGVSIRMGELLPDLQNHITHIADENERKKAEVILAEFNVLRDVLSGLIDPDSQANLWVIVDPLTGRRKIQAVSDNR